MKITTIKQLKKFTNNSKAKFLVLIEPETEQDKESIQNYFDKTSYEKPKQKRICYIESTGITTENNNRLYFAEVLHGFGYSVDDDILQSLS